MNNLWLQEVLEQRGLVVNKFFTENCVSAVENNRAVVVKLIGYSKSEFERETRFAKLAQKSKIGPKVLRSEWLEEIGGLLIQEQWDMSLEAYLQEATSQDRKNRAVLARALRRILRELKKLNLVHADLWPRNIVCCFNNGKLQRVGVIDFGISFYNGEFQADLGWPNWKHLVGWFQQNPLFEWTLEEVQADPFLLDRFVLKFLGLS